MKLQLAYNPPYSFDRTFRRLRYDTSYLYRDGVFIRAIHGQNGPIVLRISHDERQGCIEVEVHGEGKESEETWLKATLSRMFSTGVDIASLYEQFSNDDHLSGIIGQRTGMHLVLEATVYECLMKTIISQQLNLSFAATLTSRFTEIAGSSLAIGADRLTVFPRAEAVASLAYEELQQLQFNRRKAEYLIDISRKVVESEISLEGLNEKTNEEIFDILLPLRGVGRWTVECVLLFGLGRPDLLPAADVGLRNALRNVYQLQTQPNEEMVRALATDWSPYSSYVTVYLWDSLSEIGGGT